MPPTRWGEAIQRLIAERGWSQKQLADGASVRPNTLTNIIKHGKHTDTATLTRIAAALRVDIAELFATGEQSEVLRGFQDDRVKRVAESVLSELSGTVARLVREDYRQMLARAQEEPATSPHEYHVKRKKARRK
jgi:transcriptional regulator with XRE-family HTH domain